MRFAVLVQIGGYDDAPACALQLPGHVDHEVDYDLSQPFGKRSGFGAYGYLLNLHCHYTFAVLLYFGRHEVETVAVPFDLQGGRLVGLLLAFALFAADVQHVGAVLATLQMPGYRTAAKQRGQAYGNSFHYPFHFLLQFIFDQSVIRCALKFCGVGCHRERCITP